MMLFRSGQSWVVDFFLRRGWLVQRRLRHRRGSWDPVPAVPAECLEDRTLLSTITVTSLADTFNAGGGVTLRDAIQAANTDTRVDGSVAGDAGVQNLIVFQAGLTGTISMTSGLGQMTISSSLVIQGLGASSTVIDAQHNSRFFNILGGWGNVGMTGLTLENGETTANGSHASSPGNGEGGAIASLSTGTLAISNCVFSGNYTTGSDAYGGAIFDDQGPVTMSGSTLSGNST